MQATGLAIARRERLRSPRPQLPRLIAMLVALAAGATACGDDQTPDLPVPASHAANTSTPPDDNLERQQVLAAVEGYVDAANIAATTPDPDHPDLRTHATNSVYSQLSSSIRNNLEVGRKYEGGIRIVEVEVAELDLDAEYPAHHATVSGCIDLGEYILVDAQTGEPIPADRGGLERHLITFNLMLTPEDGWLVDRIQSHREEPC